MAGFKICLFKDLTQMSGNKFVEQFFSRPQSLSETTASDHLCHFPSLKKSIQVQFDVIFSQ